jgi:hypothetical protein
MLENMPCSVFNQWFKHYREHPFGPAIQTRQLAEICYMQFKVAVPDTDITLEDFLPGVKAQVELPQQDWKSARNNFRTWLNTNEQKA